MGRCGIDEFVHVREIHLQNHFNHNNKQERLSGEFKDRLNTARGLRGENSALIRLMIIYCSLFRPYSALGDRTPAGAAGIRIRGDDKWETFITRVAAGCA